MFRVNPLNAGALEWASPSAPDDVAGPSQESGLHGTPGDPAQAEGGPVALQVHKGSSWLTRSLPTRLLDTALRVLHAAEGTRAEARSHHLDNTADHERTHQLIRELGCMLALSGQSPAPLEPPCVHARLGARAPPDHEAPSYAAHAVDADAEIGGIDAVAGLAEESPPPSLEIYLLSPFRVFANDRAIDEWPNCKGKAIFKYLATHRGQPVPKEVLMDVFWPESDQDAARNNLNVAIYGLRKALARADANFAFVLFRQGCYAFNPALRLWVDAEAFVDCVHRAQAADQHGDSDAAVAAYRTAQAVYRSPLLVDDRYEDWLIPHRQALQDSHAKVLNRLAAHDYACEDYEACAGIAARMLDVDPCNEEAHRLLMRCHSRLGHAHLALRQYHFCVDALARELKLIPSPQTVSLFQQIRKRQPI